MAKGRMLTDAEALAEMTDAEVHDALDRAARDYTAYTLHAKLPVDRQGDTSPRAWALRAEFAARAERRWLDIQAELARRA